MEIATVNGIFMKSGKDRAEGKYVEMRAGGDMMESFFAIVLSCIEPR